MSEFTELKTKTAKTDYIRGKLQDNETWAIRGLVTIYKYQTMEEQNIGATVDHNGVGFSGVDSEILSSFAEQVNRGRNLSTKQVAILHKLMPKYAKQLMRVSENKQ